MVLREHDMGNTARVDFTAEHSFTALPLAVTDVMCDPAFQTRLDLPDLSRPEVVESTTNGTTRVLRLRYEYIGKLDPIARRVVGSRQLTWLQDLQVDTATMAGSLTFAAEAEPEKLFGRAVLVLTAAADGTTRRITGSLSVKVPLVGRTAERRIVPGLVQRLDVEAAATEAELKARE